MSMKEISSDSIDTKEKKNSSDGSLVMMNPVASGDNVASILNSTQKLKEEVPTLVPCCEGRELQIKQELVHGGLSAISVKHDTVLECLSVTRTQERSNFPFSTPGLGLVKHRNSFRSLHRPDLKRVPCLRKMSPSELESLFRGYTAPETKQPRHDTVPAPLEPQVEECVRVLMPTQDLKTSSKDLTIGGPINGGAEEAGAGGTLQPIPELCGASASVASEDVPSGMRLHGARARLYTSVLASARAGDQLDGISVTEPLLDEAPEPNDQEQAIDVNGPLTLEELQIILSPRREDQMPIEPSTTTADTNMS